MGLPAKVTVAAAVVAAELDGRIVLLDMRDEVYFTLDEVASRMWQLLNEEPDIGRIIDVLLKEYDVEEDTLRRDFEALVTRLEAARLVVVER